MRLPKEMLDVINDILTKPSRKAAGPEYCSIWFDPEDGEYSLTLDGDFSLEQLKKLVAYLEEIKPKLMELNKATPA